MRDMTDANRAEFEAFMAERFTDSIDRRRCINGDGNDYMSWDMGVARAVWQHMQQKLDAANAELARYSMSAGQADQFAAEAKAVRKALGYAENAEDVAPVDLLEKIAVLRAEGVEMCAAKMKATSSLALNHIAAGILEYAAELRAETNTTPSQYESLAGGK